MRTAFIGYRDQTPITIPKIEELLTDLGAYEGLTVTTGKDPFGEKTDYGTIVFVQYGDCQNALKVSCYLNPPEVH
ncbi:unnamed protein product [Penicillium salamii]|uniref:Uncharacterized protein n=1 Tax=Penicillium salamii TaxID=1612424 RepID=A0A9W4NR97_9EURO|nr:unnamed protein product [Penicillium salamii]